MCLTMRKFRIEAYIVWDGETTKEHIQKMLEELFYIDCSESDIEVTDD